MMVVLLFSSSSSKWWNCFAFQVSLVGISWLLDGVHLSIKRNWFQGMLCYFSGKQMNHVVAIGALCIFIKRSVFFFNLCRGDDGELRLGVRRAIQLKNEAFFEDFSSDSTKRHTLSAVADSLKHRSVFHISYNPRWKYIIHFYTVNLTLDQTCSPELLQFGMLIRWHTARSSTVKS